MLSVILTKIQSIGNMEVCRFLPLIPILQRDTVSLEGRIVHEDHCLDDQAWNVRNIKQKCKKHAFPFSA